MKPIIHTPPNDAPPVERVWMFVSRDSEGRENVCGAVMGDMGWQPLVTGNERMLKLFLPFAWLLEERAVEIGRTIHLLTFGTREEVADWQTTMR